MTTILLAGALRAALVLLLGLLASVLLNRATAATRRLILALTLGAALVVPLASAVVPRWRVATPQVLSGFARESANETAQVTGTAAHTGALAAPAEPATLAAVPADRDVSSVLVAVWLAVAAALLARAISSQLSARALARRAKPVATGPWAAASVEVRVSTEVESPIVTGLVRPTIVVPRHALDWTPERCRVVLVHELAHVRRRDVLVHALADLACALQWCNPLVWIAARRLRIACELAADDGVLATGVLPSRYAEELLAVATATAAPRAAIAMAERSSLETRIISIVSARVARTPLRAPGTIAVVTLATTIAAAVACASPQAPSRVPAPRTGSPIQRAADDELAAIAKRWSPELATIVVMDPATGELLATAGAATTVPMAPGSTLKAITVAAALEAHAITADQSFDSGPAPRPYGTGVVRDASVNGTLDVARILAVSSNIGTSRIFDALGGDELARTLQRFHFASAPASIASGSFEGVDVAIGEGLTATPLEMIAAYGALASDGNYHAPTVDRGGSPAERVISAETARTVMTLLEAAVLDDHATGKAARVPGVRVAGKTGTAEWTASDGRKRTYASFIGTADLPGGRVVVLVGEEAAREDMSGGSAAAPVFARLVTRLLAPRL